MFLLPMRLCNMNKCHCLFKVCSNYVHGKNVEHQPRERLRIMNDAVRKNLHNIFKYLIITIG